MGVHGWTRYLVQEGWLPSWIQPCGCTTRLWRDPRTLENNEFASHIVTIQDHSALHIDGYGLAFYLWDVAYERYVQSILHCSPCSLSVRDLASKANVDVQSLLPLMVPLSVIEAVTREYVECLVRNFQVTVYFDGDGRRLIHQETSEVSKQETTQNRVASLCEGWENLRLYCSHGSLPPGKTICQWKKDFPRPRLLFDQFRQTLIAMGVKLEDCVEECDHILAHAVRGNPNAYVLGNDSDFCFFPDTNYIPFSTLDASSRRVTACVIRRDALAESLGIPNSAMVELVILCGNDYLVNPKTAKLDFSSKMIEECIDHLASKSEEYRVTSRDSIIEETLAFLRVHYNLEDLSRFPLVMTTSDDGLKLGNHLVDLDTSVDSDDCKKPAGAGESARPEVPREVNVSLAQFLPGRDASVKDAVLRCLQDYIDRSGGQGLVNQLHCDVFRMLKVDLDYKKVLATAGKAKWRHAWGDNVAIYVITRVISASLKLSASSAMTRFCSPSSLFDFYQMHALLEDARAPLRMIAGFTESLPYAPSSDVAPSTDAEESSIEDSVKLPIDDYEEEILQRIQNNRVSIIQAETGAGKSSRVPVMILNAPIPKGAMPVQLFISQPRRIAAKALVERLRSVEPKWKDAFALRMGHGVREYESQNTRAWFVTAGYLVRLLANHPERFAKVSHLIIDEVHERSVETDLLCLLCRRLLHSNEQIRLVLMSATMAAKLYQDYFGVPEPPLRVGARRFPVEEVFLDELDSKLTLAPRIKRNVKELVERYQKIQCKEAPSISDMEKLYPVVANIAVIAARPGTSVLVFVPGMNEIVALTEAIEQLFVDGVEYTCLPIHSDIPFEDQMDAFVLPKSNEVKVIIATNSAESSVTLPAVDTVVCMGLCKQIIYNEASHRQMLMPTWISKASATQRAGRTGRLRPGTVFRIYTRENYESHMDDFEPGEMSRIPLDNVILMLKGMVSDDTVTNILLECLEPPNISTIDRSFQSLHQSHFITSPDDDCEITTLGTFVSVLGIDLALGSVIGLGIQMGVGSEAIQLAGVLSFPKTPWVISNPLIHEPGEYNAKTKDAYVSRCHFDSNLFSEPLAIMNMLWDFENRKDKNRDNWCFSFALAQSRVRRLFGTCSNLRRRVADFFEVDEKVFHITQPPVHMPHSVINILRVIQVWVFHETIIECKPPKVAISLPEKAVCLNLGSGSPKITKGHLDQILCAKRHPCELTGLLKIKQTGTYVDSSSDSTLVDSSEARYLSYAIEKNVQVVLCCDAQALYVYVQDDLWNMELFASIRQKVHASNGETTAIILEPPSGAIRGVMERSCGKWKIGSQLPSKNKSTNVRRFWRSSLASSRKPLRSEVGGQLVQFMEANVSFRCLVIEVKKKQKTKSERSEVPFGITSYGFTDKVSKTDLVDIFCSTGVKVKNVEESHGTQFLVFPVTPNKPLDKVSLVGDDVSMSSWARPLLGDCIPEGVRLLSVLASGRRREHCLRLNARCENDDTDPAKNETVDLRIDEKMTKLSKRWRRMNSDHAVYVAENCVPATAMPISAQDTLYCVASNTLEVRGGGLRAEGLTLLPPGRLFLLLSRVTFGLFKVENLLDNSLVEKCTLWIKQGSKERTSFDDERSWSDRIQRAVEFHKDATHLGEELICFPEMASRLADIFNGIDGYEAPSWEIEANPFTRENLSKWKRVYSQEKLLRRLDSVQSAGSDYLTHDQHSMPDDVVAESAVINRDDPEKEEERDDDLRELELILNATSHLSLEENGTQQDRSPKKKKRWNKRSKKTKGNDSMPSPPPMSARARKNQIASMNQGGTCLEAESLERLTSFDASSLEMMRRLFATGLTSGQSIGEYEFPSTNIHAVIVDHALRKLGSGVERNTLNDWAVFVMKVHKPDSSSTDNGGDSRVLYHAKFLNQGLRYTLVVSRPRSLPSWIKAGVHARPWLPQDALDCVPPPFRESIEKAMHVVACGATKETTQLAFESLELALRMEAAFWLERQFREKGHWYEQGDMNEMVAKLVAACQARDTKVSPAKQE